LLYMKHSIKQAQDAISCPYHFQLSFFFLTQQ
jgi:hypothetical protein